MSESFVIKKGDRRPYRDYQLKLGDDPVDITGATVSFVMRNHGEDTVLFSIPATQIAPTAGVVEIPWTPGSTDTVGIYDCSFLVTFPGGEPETFPPQGFIYLLIE